MRRLDVVVIGAGQAGLAVGYYLRRTAAYRGSRAEAFAVLGENLSLPVHSWEEPVTETEQHDESNPPDRDATAPVASMIAMARI